ncbi:MAG: right-handed parallel beta-helix repeat-containing protein, partial [Verrucomicrobiaceae bacterium]
LYLSILACCSTSLAGAAIVSNTNDSGPGSLREAINTATSQELIEFSPALDRATILLTGGSIDIISAELTIDATSLSGGITISGGGNSQIFHISGGANVTLRNLHLKDGRAHLDGRDKGGGIYALGSTITVERCTISGCSSTLDGGGFYGDSLTGGAIRLSRITGNQSSLFGGGLALNGTAAFPISNTQVSGNKAVGGGGGIYNFVSSPAITNCTIQGNSGGGVANQFPCNPVFRNCIVWGNTDTSGTVATQQIRTASPATTNVNHSLVQGASSASSFTNPAQVTWGSQNLNGTTANPQFASPATAASAPTSGADLRLLQGSSAINTGDNSSSVGSLDLAFRDRLQGAAVDLGAFEGPYVTFGLLYPSLTPGGDANGNGLSNFFEYSLGKDPLAPGSTIPQPLITSSNGSKSLSSVVRTNGVDIKSSWQTSTLLTPLSWSTMIENVDYVTSSRTSVAEGVQQITLQLQSTDPARFYRQGFSQAN